MYGALIGDIAGSRYEFDAVDTKDFELFPLGCSITDDSVMTTAVAQTLLTAKTMEEADGVFPSDEEVKALFVKNMKDWGHRYPDAGYGGRFFRWLFFGGEEPYNSLGNGSAMRVSPCGWLYGDMETTRHMAALSAEVTHNHPEGVKGAESVAAAIFLARNGSSKAEIKEYVEREFGYDLSHTIDEIRPFVTFDETCPGSVPESFIAFLDGVDYEDTIRNAISLGGDADTQAAIAGAIAEAFFGIPEELKQQAIDRSGMPDEVREVIDAVYAEIGK